MFRSSALILFILLCMQHSYGADRKFESAESCRGLSWSLLQSYITKIHKKLAEIFFLPAKHLEAEALNLSDQELQSSLINLTDIQPFFEFRTPVDNTANSSASNKSYPFGTVTQSLSGIENPKLKRGQDRLFSDYLRLCEHNLRVAHRQVRALDDLDGKLERKLWSVPDKEILNEENIAVENISLPIGAYGRKFTEDLMRTNQILYRLIDKTIPADQKIREEKNIDFFETVPGVRSAVTRPLMQDSLKEGVNTLSQLISFLAAEQITGIAEPDNLMKLLLTIGLNSKSSFVNKILPRFGVDSIGPPSIAGLYIRGGALTYNSTSSTLEMTKAFEFFLSKNKRETIELVNELQATKINKGSTEFDHARSGVVTGKGCPMALLFGNKKRTGMDVVANAYLSIFLRVSTYSNKAKS